MSEFDFMWEIGCNLRDMLKKYKISQRELASKIGVSPATITMYIQAERMPSLKNIINICLALDCDLNELITVDEIIK